MRAIQGNKCLTKISVKIAVARHRFDRPPDQVNRGGGISLLCLEDTQEMQRVWLRWNGCQHLPVQRFRLSQSTLLM
jgi:hypothetical protein